MRRIGVTAFVTLAAVGGLSACSRTVHAHGAPAARVLHDEGHPLEVTLLAVYPGQAHVQRTVDQVHWVQVLLRNPDRTRLSLTRAPQILFVDAAGKADDNLLSNPPYAFPEDADPEHPRFDHLIHLGPGAVAVGDIPVESSASAGPPRLVRAKLGTETADWQLDGLPTAPIDQPVPAPARTVPLGRSVTLTGSGRDGGIDKGRPVDSRVTVAVLAQHTGRPPRAAPPGFGLAVLTIRLTNVGRRPFEAAAAEAMVAFDIHGHPVRTVPMEGSAEIWAGELVAAGATRTREVGLLVPAQVTLSHVQFNLDGGTAAAVGWWRLS